jgi:hypothetical protein
MIKNVGKKNLNKHVNDIFNEGNKMMKAQVNVQLVPRIFVPASLVISTNTAIGDFYEFGKYIRAQKRVENSFNILMHDNYNQVVGVSFVGTLGTKGFNFAVCKNHYIVCFHELMHGFGCQHTFGKGGLMDYVSQQINGVVQMHIDNKPQICPTLKYWFQ